MATTWSTTAWVAAWRDTEWSIWLALAFVAVPYAWGITRLWRRAGAGRGIPVWRAALYAAGVVLLIVALASPLDTMADSLFAAHMTQHMLLIAVVPPLLILGAPLTALAWLGPLQRLLQPAQPFLHRVGRVATIPVWAFSAHAVVLWAWHAPPFYQAALLNPTLHAAEHATLFGTAMLLWWSALRPTGIRRVGYGIGVLTLLATAMQSGALGALLTVSRTPWYAIGSASATAWGLTPLADQQLAGLIMWIPGGLIYTLAACALFLAWFGPVTLPAALPQTVRVP
ncbi:MAG TPA: cytochrome c oxidase assembly protein [Gemmatimonadales bacterium]